MQVDRGVRGARRVGRPRGAGGEAVGRRHGAVFPGCGRQADSAETARATTAKWQTAAATTRAWKISW